MTRTRSGSIPDMAAAPPAARGGAPGHTRGVDVWFITGTGIERREVAELPALLARDDGIVWVDVPQCDEQVAEVLLDVLGCHPLAVRDCFQRNRVARVHAYPQQVFLVLHAPHLGAGGHVHYVELDQFVGERHLVTVHGPVNPAVPAEVPQRETGAVLARIEALTRPASPHELSYAIVSALPGARRPSSSR